jgi:hypothetical protein
MPAVTLPHVCDGVSVLLLQVFCMFRRPSMCRPVHCQFMRNELHNFTTIVPVTVYHHGSYVETYSRSRGKRSFLVTYRAHCHTWGPMALDP